MAFKHPVFLLLLVLIPAALAIRWRFKPASVTFPESGLLRGLPRTWRARTFRLPDLFRAFACALVVLALARPQSVTAERELETSGVDIVLSLDISGSMLAEDFKPDNRMAIAKQEAKRFIQGRTSDRIGLVVFARKAYTQCPLTLDYDVLIRLLDEVEIGAIKDGTAIGLGIGTAVNRLRSSEAKSKIIILITDGENNAGNIDPITAADLARSFGVKIYTIGVGRGGLVPFPVMDPILGKRYIQANVAIDEDTLKRIAQLSGGLYFRAFDPQSLREIYKKIDALERTDITVKQYTTHEELFPVFLWPGIGVVLAGFSLSRTVYAALP